MQPTGQPQLYTTQLVTDSISDAEGSDNIPNDVAVPASDHD